jgi:hypothetical protein
VDLSLKNSYNKFLTWEGYDKSKTLIAPERKGKAIEREHRRAHVIGHFSHVFHECI